jgi:hypothetical protein
MQLRTSIATALFVVACASLAIACSVPVFRYALEHWRPDPYTVFVFSDGELTNEQLDIAKSMQTRGANGQPAANVTVKVVDVNSVTDPLAQQIWNDNKSSPLPLLVVQSPPKWGPSQTVLQTEFTANNAALVIDSPIRSTIGKRLTDGESVVWVYLENGDKEQDDKTFAMLTTELVKLESTIKMPEIEEADLADLAVDPQTLRVAFSAVRISRDDIAEQALIQMLLRVEPDLLDEDVVKQPMAFPVFGRGRALYALVGAGITPGLIEEASEFLAGACQCTVKADNPGVDLIMNVAWDDLVTPIQTLDETLPPLAGFSGFGESDDVAHDASQPESTADLMPDTSDVASAIPDGATDIATAETDHGSTDSAHGDTTSGRSSSSLAQNMMFVLLFLVVGVVVTTFVIRPRN